jgi:hypothetical protein
VCAIDENIAKMILLEEKEDDGNTKSSHERQQENKFCKLTLDTVE